MLVIDLNADLGEGYPYDEELLGIISSANICTDAYTGNPEASLRAVHKAVETETVIGAHCGYPNIKNFGRKSLRMTPDELEEELVEQLFRFHQRCVSAGAVNGFDYIKPHGALYHDASELVHVQHALVKLAASYGVPLMHVPNSPMRELATEVEMIEEGFADRRYVTAGLLVDRSSPDAHLVFVDKVAQQGVALAMGTPFAGLRGSITLKVQSICLHGDSENAVGKARAVKHALQLARFSIKSFV